MAKLPGSFAYEGFFFVDGVGANKKRFLDKLRLPEEVKVLRTFHTHGNNIAFRLPLKNTIVFKGRIAEYGNPVGSPPPFVDKLPPVPPHGESFIIRGDKPEAAIKTGNPK
jgi:hypothetical protein